MNAKLYKQECVLLRNDLDEANTLIEELSKENKKLYFENKEQKRIALETLQMAMEVTKEKDTLKDAIKAALFTIDKWSDWWHTILAKKEQIGNDPTVKALYASYDLLKELTGPKRGL